MFAMLKTSAVVLALLALLGGTAACAPEFAPTVPVEPGASADEAASRTARIETFTDEDGRRRFCLVAANGETLLRSIPYAAETDLRAGITAVRAAADRSGYYEHQGRWVDEDKLVQGDYDVVVTDARRLDGLVLGDVAYVGRALSRFAVHPYGARGAYGCTATCRHGSAVPLGNIPERYSSRLV
jgi:uncharacterized protein YegP (UPF0339 family)